jgi:hypothetical protein
MAENINIVAGKVKADGDSSIGDPVLAKYAAEIRRLGKRVKEDVVAIGRYLDQAQKHAGRGAWLAWIQTEFGWSDQTAYNYIHLYKAQLQGDDLTFQKFWNANLPLSSLYLLAKPKTPDEARKEIADRLEAGEKVTCAAVTETIARAKGATDIEGVPAETGTPEESPSLAGTRESDEDPSTAAHRARMAALAAEPEPATGQTNGADPQISNHADDRAGVPRRAAEDPIGVAIAAVDRLDRTQLRALLNRINPDHRSALKQHFGRSKSDNAFVEIAQLARDCTAMMAHAKQHTADIHKKLARIRKLAGGKSSARGKTESNAQLDHGAFARGMGLAGFPTMNMAPKGTDPSGNPIFTPQGRGGRSQAH